VGELWLVGVLVSAALALRILTEIVVIFWSFQADEDGRKHAIKILEQLGNRRGRKPP
jgi:hypothetical protein